MWLLSWHSWYVILDMSLLISHLWLITLDLELVISNSWLVTLDFSPLTCLFWLVILVTFNRQLISFVSSFWDFVKCFIILYGLGKFCRILENLVWSCIPLSRRSLLQGNAQCPCLKDRGVHGILEKDVIILFMTLWLLKF